MNLIDLNTTCEDLDDYITISHINKNTKALSGSIHMCESNHGTKSAKPVHETYCGNNMRKQESIKLWQSAENPIDLEQEKGTRLISRLLSSLDKIDLIS